MYSTRAESRVQDLSNTNFNVHSAPQPSENFKTPFRNPTCSLLMTSTRDLGKLNEEVIPFFGAAFVFTVGWEPRRKAGQRKIGL